MRKCLIVLLLLAVVYSICSCSSKTSEVSTMTDRSDIEQVSSDKAKDIISGEHVINAEGATEATAPTTTSVKFFKDIPRIPESAKPYTYFINTVDNEDIFPDITTAPILWYEGLEAISGSQLWLLRNEIYARHGYVFQSKELNNYFLEKSWYKPEPSIKEIKLSKTEQENLNLIQNYENRKPFVLIGGTVISWDLDGDGSKELIQFDAPGYQEYTLHVNNESITAEGDNLMGYCSVIDMDTSDSQCEILVRSLGPSNDDSFQIYRYKSNHIESIGHANGWLCEVPGNGYGSIRIRASILQTWFLLDLYHLDNHGMLADVEQQEYPVLAEIRMNHKEAVLEETPYIFPEPQKQVKDGFYPSEYNIITILKDLPVVTAPSNPQPAGVIKHEERVVFLGSDNSQWVKIQGEDGITGWFQLHNYNVMSLDGKDYPADKFFSYLCNAD